MIKTQKLATVIGLLAGSLALSADAAIQYTPWQDFADDTLRNTSASGDTTVGIGQYNPADYGGAPLHNVELDLSANGFVTFSVTDLSGSPNNYNLDVDIIVGLSGAGVIDPLVIAIPQIVSTDIVLAADETVSSPGYPTDFPNGLTGAQSASSTYQGATLTAAIVNLFTGTGTIDLDAGATQDNQSSATGDVTQTVLSRYNFSGRVRYSYEVAQTPEPTVMLLFGAGLAGIGATLRRRRRSA
jgi:hypothetical protein